MPEESPIAEVESETPDVKRKFLRITSTMYLDWPQLGFELHSLESGKVNEFASPEELPEEVVKKLKGFFRSGHVKVFVMTELEDGTLSSIDQTPTAEELAEDDDVEEPPPADGEPPASAEPPAPAASTEPEAQPQPAAQEPAAPAEPPPADGEPPAA